MKKEPIKGIKTTNNSTEYWNRFIDEIISSIIAAIFCYFISESYIITSGIVNVALKILLIVSIYIILKISLKKGRGYIRTKLELKRADKKSLSKTEATNLSDSFHEDAFNYIESAFNKITLIESKEEICIKELYLNQAYSHYNSALSITYLVVYFHDSCMRQTDNSIKNYQIINMYELLKECNIMIRKNSIKSSTVSEEIIQDLDNSNIYLNKIEVFVKKLNNINIS